MGLDFSKLASLRLRAQQILEDQAASLEYFAYDGGYQQYKGKNKISVSSTATCVLSLVATGEWEAGKTETKALLEKLISKKTSAGLPEDNPFTVAWILEAVTALQERSDALAANAAARVVEMEQILQNAVKSGGVNIGSYPPTAYLTQLVVRALKGRSKLTEDLERAVNSWAWGELPYQIGLVQAKSKTADAFAVAYLVMLVTAVTPGTRPRLNKPRSSALASRRSLTASVKTMGPGRSAALYFTTRSSATPTAMNTRC